MLLTIDESMTTKGCFCGAKFESHFFGIPREWISKKSRQQYKSLGHAFDMFTPKTNTGSEDHDNLACPICMKSFPRDPKSASLIGLLLLSYMVYKYRPYFLQRTCDKQVVASADLDEYVTKEKEKRKRQRNRQIHRGHEHTFTSYGHNVLICLKDIL